MIVKKDHAFLLAFRRHDYKIDWLFDSISPFSPHIVKDAGLEFMESNFPIGPKYIYISCPLPSCVFFHLSISSLVNSTTMPAFPCVCVTCAILVCFFVSVFLISSWLHHCLCHVSYSSGLSFFAWPVKGGWWACPAGLPRGGWAPKMPTFLGGQNPQDGEGESNIGIGESVWEKSRYLLLLQRDRMDITHGVIFIGHIRRFSFSAN